MHKVSQASLFNILQVIVYPFVNVLFIMIIFFRTSNDKLFSINEEVQREALKGFYDRCLRKR